MGLLQTEELTFTYPGCTRPALEGVSLDIPAGGFVLLMGESGCGKTTLLRLLKRELTPAGRQEGQVLYDGRPLSAADAGQIGYVMQNPESQIVTDQVWHELAFGLENLGVPTSVIRRRVGEMASFFGIQDWFRRPTDTLSGGQKQLLNLAAVMVMRPRVLLLDEPTAQLDPLAAEEFLSVVTRLNRELGVTVVLAEHRLESAFAAADRVVVLESGRVRLATPPRQAAQQMNALPPEHPLRLGLPAAARLHGLLSGEGECPLTVREGQDWLRRVAAPAAPEQPAPPREPVAPAVELREVWFRYEKELPDILRGTSVRIEKGEIFCLLGGNGSGKTTTLQMMAGLDRPRQGQVRIAGKPAEKYTGGSLYRRMVALLPQDPRTVFVCETVEQELAETLCRMDYPAAGQKERLQQAAADWGLTHLLGRHPYDLSGGEQQRCALAKLMLLEPQILLLDEPTKGMDAGAKQRLRQTLYTLRDRELTVVLVTHDVEFAALCADRCALFFDGEILPPEPPAVFFGDNTFYTTAAARIAHGLYPRAVTCEAVAACCRGEVAP